MTDPSPPYQDTLARLEPRAAPTPAAIVAAWLFVEFTRSPVDIRVDGSVVVIRGPAAHGEDIRQRMHALLAERRFAGWSMTGG